MFATIVTTVIGALCVAAILGIIKSRWLYVISPKLYLNTPISNGQIVSLTIHNAGLSSEEDVALSLRPGCKFELIATSKSTLNVHNNTISIAKLSKMEKVTVLLLIEEKTFDHADIESIESKSTKGKIVEKQEQVVAAWQSIIVLPILLVLVIFPFMGGTWVGAEMKVSAFQWINDKLELVGPSKQLAGFKNSLQEWNDNGGVLGSEFRSGRLKIETTEVLQRKDVLTISSTITNKTKKPLMVEGYSDSSAGERGPVDFYDARVETFGLAPNEKKVVKIKAYLPETLSVKMVRTIFSFKTLDGDSLSIAQTMQFN